MVLIEANSSLNSLTEITIDSSNKILFKGNAF